MRNIFAWSDSGRLEELQGYEILDSAPDDRFDRISVLASRTLEAPMAFITIFDSERLLLKSKVCVTFTECPRNSSFFLDVYDGGFLEIEDAHADDQFRGSAWAKGETAMRFFAGAPIVPPRGATLGDR